MDFRSTWEANYARYLNSIGVAWKFESITLDTPHGSYNPDFYLPQFNTYIEIKGYEKRPEQLDKRNWLRDNKVINLIDVFGRYLLIQ